MATAPVVPVDKNPIAEKVDELFREHYELVYRTAYGMTAKSEDAEDIAQTIFVRLLGRELPLDLIRNPKAYLYRAAVNLSLNTMRQRRRRGQLMLPEAFAAPEPIDSSAEERERRLLQAIGELHETAAEILILRYVHNYSLGDIARLVGTTRSTVAVSLFRSRLRLKKLLRALEGEDS